MLAASAQPRVCSVCNVREFFPKNSMHRVCSQRCATKLAKAAETARKLAQKVEKAQDRAKRDRMKTLSQLEGECRRIVQAIARVRDRDDGCISCHLGPGWDGQWHGSHFRPAGNHSAVEMHLWNIHKSCSACNRHKSGNIAEYTPRLIAKIGQERVDWLNSQNQTVKRTREYLARFKVVMGKRLRRQLKAAQE